MSGATRLATGRAYVAGILALSATGRGLEKAWEVAVIPLWDYVAAVALSAAIVGVVRLLRPRAGYPAHPAR